MLAWLEESNFIQKDGLYQWLGAHLFKDSITCQGLEDKMVVREKMMEKS